MRFVILLRGINVGSTRSLPMKELVELLEGLGLTDVRTYIQSGNVVADSGKKAPDELEVEIAEAVEKLKGFKPQILVLKKKELEQAIRSNPFPEAESEPKTLHLFFLESKPESPDTEAIEATKTSTERYLLTDRVFYFHTPDGLGRSKLATNVEKYIGVPATARNWRTVMKIAEMMDGS